MNVHLVGVSGTGMGALAALLRAAGHEVSGSDVAFDPPIGPTLEAAGVALHGRLRRRSRRARAASTRSRRRRQRDPEEQPGGGGGGAPWPRARLDVGSSARAVPRGASFARRGGHARQDDDERHVRLAPRARRVRAGVVHRRRAEGAAGGRRDRLSARPAGPRPHALRRRGRRVRRRLLAEAPEVHRLHRSGPGRRRHRHERRARPRRHLPRRARPTRPRSATSSAPCRRGASSSAMPATRERGRSCEPRHARGSSGTRSSTTTPATCCRRGSARPRRTARTARTRSTSSWAVARAGASRSACRARTTSGTPSRRSLRARRASARVSPTRERTSRRSRASNVGRSSWASRGACGVRRLRASPDRRRRDAARAAGSPPARRALGRLRTPQRHGVPRAPPGGVCARVRCGRPRAARSARTDERARWRTTRPRAAGPRAGPQGGRRSRRGRHRRAHRRGRARRGHRGALLERLVRRDSTTRCSGGWWSARNRAPRE